MSQPTAEPMTTTEAEAAIESYLDQNSLTDTEEVEPEQEVQEEVGESEEAEPETDEAEETDDEPEEEPESEETDDEAQDSIETLADLAEALELPLEEVMANLKTTVKVNGEEIPVTLKEAFDGYQKDADYRHKTSELAQQRRTFESEATQARQQLEQQFIQLGQFMQNAEQMFVPQMDQAQMEYLRETDPQKYLMAKYEHDERVAKVRGLKEKAAQEFVANQQALQQQQQAQLQEVMQKASDELVQRVPDWSNDTKSAVDNYLTGEKFGYTAEELAGVVDPRLVELAYKAMKYDQQAKKADVTKQKVKTLPKVQPKGSQGKVAPKTDKLVKAKQRLKRSGSIDDAAAAVEQLLF